MSIVRRAKNPQIPPIIRYKDVRPVIAAYLSDPNRRIEGLLAAEQMFQQRAGDSAVGPLKQDDALKSIEVLHAVQSMSNKLGSYDFRSAPITQPKLQLSGVEISIRADLMVHGSRRSLDQIGAAIFRMTQDDAQTEEARSRREAMGLYVATLAKKHVDLHLNQGLEPANRLCMSIDIQHREVFVAPAANSRRLNDLENACRMIAAIWSTV